MTPKIIIYGRAEGCQGCTDVKSLMSEYDLPYDFRDIGSGDVARRVQYKKELMANRVDKIPYIIIDGKDEIVKFIGFDENKLREAIDKAIK